VDGVAVEGKMSRLSFVVVACSKPQSLRTCLSSLVEQTKGDIEIIVVDNTPNEDSGSIAFNREFCRMDSRIRYEWVADRTVIDKPHIRHKHCLYTATEIGVEMATGEWLCFPNQDSYYAPVFVERMFQAADECFTEFCYCDIVLGGPGHGYFPLSTAPRNCAIDKTCYMLRREWFMGFEGKHENYELEDGYFVERLIARGIKHRKCVQPLVVHN
jgi:glycosyltransferase involved in cell wall biosynthesis